ncbi:uncharacterized protein KGF55_004050 [Candida pseudojiufengensis]|uniref:uncharacterized protein n=1 Tax=Candida pseudojiufengensis TaxID=497109 RepID=UPI0022258EB2|nr:uncharacterized protein KGF55_004050 [Candida pseudojiufengensis]KAI5961427.1 hypothetical protein KGF55_004050 [Candida pseudojiufengensis]
MSTMEPEKTGYKNYSRQKLLEIVDECREAPAEQLRQLKRLRCDEFDIPIRTLNTYLKLDPSMMDIEKSNEKLTRLEEKELCNYLMEAAQKGVPIDGKTLMLSAINLLQKRDPKGSLSPGWLK